MSTYDAIKIEGRTEGRIEGKIETILNAYDNGIGTALIANITNMTEKEVIKILKEKGKMK